MEAIDRYGVARGSLMAIWRILRCHPFAKGGFDPVSELKVIEPSRGGVPLQSDGETGLCSH
jgi:putative component of membrane protein insertase Oxa1/YidC/SpoIIIJ protein YidD